MGSGLRSGNGLHLHLPHHCLQRPLFRLSNSVHSIEAGLLCAVALFMGVGDAVAGIGKKCAKMRKMRQRMR